MSLPAKLGLIYVISEVALSLLRRADPKAKRQDGGSLTVLWVTITGAMIGAAVVTAYVPAAHYDLAPSVAQVFGTLFAFGLVLRWWGSINKCCPRESELSALSARPVSCSQAGVDCDSTSKGTSQASRAPLARTTSSRSKAATGSYSTVTRCLRKVASMRWCNVSE